MNTSELLHIRLHNQLLTTHELKEPQEIVAWMGAMQAQMLDLARWAIGGRLENKSVTDINEALNSGKVIRTHILRPTWHFVSADDFHWMYDLSSPRLKPVYQSYAKQSGADIAFVNRTIPRLEKVLMNGKHLTKVEISEALQTHDIALDATHLNMLIHFAEMEGLIVNGRLKGNKQTYTLLEEWVTRKHQLSNEEAIERLARRFFSSHAPATLQDFAWWSGLTLTDCKKGIESIKGDFVSETINNRPFWLQNDLKTVPNDVHSALLLAPFDEFVVSYKDRSELIADHHYSKVMTKNGIFSPTLMLDGEIIGSWKKSIKKGVPQIELSYFEKTPKSIQQLFEPERKRLEQFYTNSI